MTKQNSLQPPRFATWLLEQFSSVLQNAPLAGDLIEAFKQGRSSGWYWRQVFGAILIGLLNLLRKQWGCVVYAACCSGVISAAWFLPWFPNSRRGSLGALYDKGYGMEWPWSFAYQMSFNVAYVTCFQCGMVAVALCVYLALFRILNPRNLLRALLVIVVVLASINAVWVFLGFIGMGLWGGSVLYWVLFSTVTLVALLLGMWKANPDGASRPAST